MYLIENKHISIHLVKQNSIDFFTQKKSFLLFIFSTSIILPFLLIFCTEVSAQKKQLNVIQLSGYILDKEEGTPVPGVHLYVPKKGRGTTSNLSGYFTLPLLAGDSLLITSVSHEKKLYKVPKNIESEHIVYFELNKDVKRLKEVIVTPWPTEALFKQAFLNFKLPEGQLQRELYNEEILKMVSLKIQSDGQSSYRNYQNLIQQDHNRRMLYQPNALMVFTNPFAWYSTIKSIKRGDFSKRKKRSQERKNRYQSYSD